jgi:hypothetical protein
MSDAAFRRRLPSLTRRHSAGTMLPLDASPSGMVMPPTGASAYAIKDHGQIVGL